MLLAAVALCDCAKEYDDSELRGRIENLETWQKTVNNQISAFQGVVIALEGKDYVISVVELTDKSGYTITFSKSAPVTIKHGQKGADAVAPVIGVKKDTDGKYYWTLSGEYIISDGNKIPTTGNSAVSPQARINTTTNIWELSTNGGITWTSTGVKATGEQGDAIFAKGGIDTSDPNSVTFTLVDGTTTITLPRISSITIGFDDYTSFPIVSDYARNTGVILSKLTDCKRCEYKFAVGDQYPILIKQTTK